MGNGPLWAWVNYTGAPDMTTAAYMEAQASLEALRRQLLEDVRAGFGDPVDVPGPGVHGGDEGPAPAVTGRGRLHACEPEDEPALLAGCLWERDAYEEGEDEPTVGDLLDGLIAAGVLGVVGTAARWVVAGEPSVYGDGGEYVQEAVALARVAGLDVYDSDTRTWVYREPVTCDACADGECADYPEDLA